MMKILAVCRWGFDTPTRALFYNWYRDDDTDVLLYVMHESYRLGVASSTDLKTCPFYIGTWDTPMYVDIEELKSVIEFYKPDVIYHGQETYRPQAMLRAKIFKEYNIPQVNAVSQNLLTVPESKEEVEKEKQVIKIVDGFLACSNSVVERYKALGAENIINSPIGAIDHTVFYPLEVKDKRSIRHKYNISQTNKFIIIYAGRIIKQKGIHNVITAVSQMPENVRESMEFVIMGSEYDFTQELLSLADSLNVRHLINFKGRIQKRDNFAEIIRCGDIFVYPSISTDGWVEQLGLSPIEASMSGLPCIVSNTGGLKDVVTNNKNGLLIEQNNVPELSDAITKLFMDNDMRYSMGKNGVKMMIDKYSTEYVAKKQLEFMRSLI